MRNWVQTAALCGLIVGAPMAAHGTERQSREGYYAPPGVRLGGFTLFGDVELSVGIDDNILAHETNEIDGTYYAIFSEANLISNWSWHELALNAWHALVLNDGLSSEDQSNWGVSAEGRVDVSYATWIRARAAYAMLTESRGDTNFISNAAEPTEYDRFDSYLELQHRFNRLGVSLGGGMTIFDYDDVREVGGGTIDNDERDRTILLARAQADYVLSPDTRAFVRVTFNQREYDQQPPAVLVSRDSEGYEIAGGLSFDIAALIEGEVFAGYLAQDYDVLSDIDGLFYGASIDWFVTQLTTVSASLTRSVEETNSIGASGYLRTVARVSVNHELRRNILLTADASYSTNEYEGNGRDEDIWSVGLAAEYWMNRYLSAKVGYRFETRESTLLGADYNRNRAHVSLIGHF